MINESQKDDPRMWEKWSRSGAVSTDASKIDSEDSFFASDRRARMLREKCVDLIGCLERMSKEPVGTGSHSNLLKKRESIHRDFIREGITIDCQVGLHKEEYKNPLTLVRWVAGQLYPLSVNRADYDQLPEEQREKVRAARGSSPTVLSTSRRFLRVPV